jgi:hypothetical protein
MLPENGGNEDKNNQSGRATGTVALKRIANPRLAHSRPQSLSPLPKRLKSACAAIQDPNGGMDKQQIG